jgi:hypothetical protein
LPSTQNVEVVGGSITSELTPVRAANVLVFNVDSLGNELQSFPALDVSTVFFTVYGPINVYYATPLSGGHEIVALDSDGIHTSEPQNFVHPIPLNGVHVFCGDDKCGAIVAMFGF